jgi:hypothetical protein
MIKSALARLGDWRQKNAYDDEARILNTCCCVPSAFVADVKLYSIGQTSFVNDSNIVTYPGS